MKAAVVHTFGAPPRFAEFREPEPAAGEVLVEVRAAALTHLTRGQAAGRHYSSPDALPFVPGADGVGRTPDGARVFFLGSREPFGSMAERTVVSARRCLPLPEGVDDITAAALGNPGIATWAALLGRARLEPGERVLVNGATGTTGHQAVQVAKYLGASHVIATGRNPAALERLRSLGADETISLDQSDDALRAVFKRLLHEPGVQVIVDYIWGRSAELLLSVAGGHGAAAGEGRVRFVQVGAIAGPGITLRAEWLRSSGVELLGSGLGSLSAPEIVAALKRMYAAQAETPLQIETEVVPLSDVETAWTRAESRRRVVFTI